MKKIRIGILGAADIAERRFLPALNKVNAFSFAGVAISGVSRQEKAERFTAAYGGKIYLGYEELLRDPEIDAVYIPQPPAFHYKWARLAISYGKHVFLEKPSTTSLADTQELVCLARKAGTALAENYAFCYHRQTAVIRSVIESGQLGELRLVRTAFGFPYRDSQDFRYHARLGGGALLDCGGYTVKGARLFLGKDAQVTASALNHTQAHDVDMFGSATLQNKEGLTAQVSFGMDNFYKCELEIWGSEGYLLAPRFYTPPADFAAEIITKTKDGENIVRVEPDDQFAHMAERFAEYVRDPKAAEKAMEDMVCQMELVQSIQTGNR